MNLNGVGLIDYIKNRIGKDKNYMCAIVGQTGSSKSCTALSLAERLDDNFSLERVCFHADGFMELLNSKKLKPGDVIIWDEVGAGRGGRSREWYTKTNRAIDYVMQTFRHQNLIVFFTTPSMKFIDSHLRILFHGIIRTNWIDFKRKIAHVNYMMIDHDAVRDKTYYKHLHYRNKNGNVVKLKDIGIPHPSMDLFEDYQKKKEEFTAVLNKESEEDIEYADKKRKGLLGCQPINIDEMVKKVLASPKEYTKKYHDRKIINKHLIQAEGYGVATANKIKAACEKKLGY